MTNKISALSETENHNDYESNSSGLDQQENDTTQISAANSMIISSSSSHMEPAIDYEDRQATNPDQLSSFNLSKSSTSSQTPNSLVMMMKTNGATSTVVSSSSSQQSPLTPRQIKQRNTAKRNSIPRSTSNTITTIATTGSGLTVEEDLQFLQAQKFDAEFLMTTKELFQRFPNAKISISVTLSSVQPTSATTISTHQSHPATQQRQIEIDRIMFERLCASTAATWLNSSNINTKMQPKAPLRTTSVLTSANLTTSQCSPGGAVVVNGTGNNQQLSVSSSSTTSSSSSSSSSAYDSTDLSKSDSYLNLIQIYQSSDPT